MRDMVAGLGPFGSSIENRVFFGMIGKGTERPKGKPDRLLAFSDGVLAIIITLMILEIHLPEVSHQATSQEVYTAFLKTLPHLLAYVLSFTNLAIFWINHHTLFRIVVEADTGLLWHNCHVLFWASLVPLATAFLGEHYLLPEATMLYGAVQLMVLLAGMAMVAHLFSHKLVHGALSPAMRRYYTRLNGSSVALSIAAMLLGYIATWISIVCFVVIIVLYCVPKPVEVLRDEERLIADAKEVGQ